MSGASANGADIATDMAVDHADSNNAAEADPGHALLINGNGEAKERELEAAGDGVDFVQRHFANVASHVDSGSHDTAPLLIGTGPIPVTMRAACLRSSARPL